MGKVKKGGWLDKVLHSTERFIVNATPYVMVLLALLLIAEFTMDLHEYYTTVEFIDTFIIVFFILDLVFKYTHTVAVSRFVKLYWVEIIAVFPFYHLMRFFTEVAGIGEIITGGQKLTHEALLVRETELVAREARVVREVRILREIELFGREMPVLGRITRFFQQLGRLIYARLHFTNASMGHHDQKHR